jgi:hypothetical protein
LNYILCRTLCTVWRTYFRPQFEPIWWSYVHAICLFLLFFDISEKMVRGQLRRTVGHIPTQTDAWSFSHPRVDGNRSVWTFWASKMRWPAGNGLNGKFMLFPSRSLDLSIPPSRMKQLHTCQVSSWAAE